MTTLALLVTLTNVPGRVTPVTKGTTATTDTFHADGSAVVWFEGVRFPVCLSAGEYSIVDAPKPAKRVTCSTCNDTGFDGDGCPYCGRY